MAKHIIHRLIDDLDGSDADETVSFAIDGYSYDIDLSGPHALELRKSLEKYMVAGSRTGRVGSLPQLGRSRGPVSGAQARQTVREGRQDNSAIREWAKGNHYDVAERGRIPEHIVNAYHQRRAISHSSDLLDELTNHKPASAPAKAVPEVNFAAETPPDAKPTKRTRSKAAAV